MAGFRAHLTPGVIELHRRVVSICREYAIPVFLLEAEGAEVQFCHATIDPLSPSQALWLQAVVQEAARRAKVKAELTLWPLTYVVDLDRSLTGPELRRHRMSAAR